MLIAWGLVTRAAKAPEKYKGIYDTRMQLKAMQVAASDKKESKKYKKAQLPYKKMLNALSGAMKDNLNPAYDPRNNNTMCINGQLMLLDLIEHLEEKVPGFELIQSNTDGLIIFIPDTDESFNAVDDVCYEWECRCSTELCNISLALDTVSEIYQKDVNNYLWIEESGKLERKGAYLKELSSIDNDLPILNKALVDYMSKGVPVEQTINECDELIMFQKVVKLSDAYDHVEHEEGDYEILTKSKKNLYKYKKTVSFSYKSYRVFASSDPDDGRILKVKPGKNGEKFANTSEHCFIWNASLDGVPVPDKLDRSWYIEEAKKRLKQFKVED
jgi:DNA polymerase